MNSRKKWLRRKSAPPSVTRQNELVSTHVLEYDLTHDVVTTEILRHPMAASDKRVYEALTVVGIMQRGGASPFSRQQLTSVEYVLPLKNTLDRAYGEHKNRHVDYEIGPVEIEINNWLKAYKQEPVDLQAQHDFLPVDDEVAREAYSESGGDSEGEDDYLDGAHHRQRSIFLLNNFFCSSHIPRLPSALNRPAFNVAVNSFLMLEAMFFLFALSMIDQRDSSKINFSTLFNFFTDTVTFNAFIAIGLGATTALFYQPEVPRHRR